MAELEQDYIAYVRNTHHPDPTEVYVLTFRAIPGNWRTPPIMRLRALLKAALRGYGFRCEDIKEL